MKSNIVQEKSFKFAVRIINLYRFLTENKKEFVISKQLLRSGTSIGANAEEAIGSQSKKDFISKFSIAYKEARETTYWIKLLKESNYLGETQYLSILNDCEELLKIITKILKSSKQKLVIKNS